MNAFDIPAPDSRKARVEIIPLIDVIFFLLATFVLFTLSLNKIASVEAPLPTGGVEKTSIPTVYIQASEPGTFYWKEGADATPELLTLPLLGPRLQDYSRRVATPRVFVRSDNKARFGASVQVLDEVRKAGIKQVAVETITSPTGR